MKVIGAVLCSLLLATSLSLAVNAQSVQDIESQYARSKDGVTALKQLENFMREHPDNIAARMLAGRILELQGYGGLADEQFKEADRLNPTHATAVLDEFRLKLTQQGPLAAQQYLRYVQHRFPNDPDVLRLAGLLETLHGNQVFAEFYYLDAIEKNPGVPGLKTALAGLRTSQKRYDEARKLLEEDFKLKADSVATTLAMGQLNVAMGRMNAAYPYLRKVYELKGPARAGISELFARVCMATGRYQEAVEPLCLVMGLTNNADGKKIIQTKLLFLSLVPRVPAPEIINTIRKVAAELPTIEQKAQLLMGMADVLDRSNVNNSELLFAEGAQLVPLYAAKPFVRIGDIYLRNRDYFRAQQMYQSASLNAENRIVDAKLYRIEQRAENQNRDLAWRIKDWLRGGRLSEPAAKHTPPAIPSS